MLKKLSNNLKNFFLKFKEINNINKIKPRFIFYSENKAYLKYGYPILEYLSKKYPGQLTKDIVLYEFLKYWPLFITVLIGGQIGSFLNIKFLSNKTLALLTSLLVIFVAMRMGIRIFI